MIFKLESPNNSQFYKSAKIFFNIQIRVFRIKNSPFVTGFQKRKILVALPNNNILMLVIWNNALLKNFS